MELQRLSFATRKSDSSTNAGLGKALKPVKVFFHIDRG